jgi:hypothetical protein
MIRILLISNFKLNHSQSFILGHHISRRSRHESYDYVKESASQKNIKSH